AGCIHHHAKDGAVARGADDEIAAGPHLLRAHRFNTYASDVALLLERSHQLSILYATSRGVLLELRQRGSTVILVRRRGLDLRLQPTGVEHQLLGVQPSDDALCLAALEARGEVTRRLELLSLQGGHAIERGKACHQSR